MDAPVARRTLVSITAVSLAAWVVALVVAVLAVTVASTPALG
jgi:hypothetical protein